LKHVRFFRACGIRKIIGAPVGDRVANLRISSTEWESEAARQRTWEDGSEMIRKAQTCG
jgi:hypothetical protein